MLDTTFSLVALLKCFDDFGVSFWNYFLSRLSFAQFLGSTLFVLVEKFFMVFLAYICLLGYLDN
jgi:hypothetical protein